MADGYRTDSVSDPWYQYRNILGVPSRKRIMFVVFAICFILTLVVITFTVLDNNCCPNSETLQTFNAFHSALNTSIDPCVDFYDFTCGLWSQKNDLPLEKLRITNFDLLQDAVNDKKHKILQFATESPDYPTVVNSAIRFYNLCVHRNKSLDDDFKVIFEYLKKIGGWPITSGDWDESYFDWINATAFLSRNLGVNIFLDITLQQIGGDAVFFVKQPVFSDIQDQYNLFIMILWHLNSSDLFFDYNITANSYRKLKEIYSVNISDSSSTFTVGNLIVEVPEIDWLRYLNIKYGEKLFELNKTVSLEDIVVVEKLDYIKNLGQSLSSESFSKMELGYLFGSAVVLKMYVLIPGVVHDYGRQFSYNEEEELLLVRDRCFELMNDIFSCSLDYLYIINLSFSNFQDSRTLTTFVKSAFSDIMQDSNWVDAVSKETALIKLNKMTEIIGFPPYMKNKTEIDLLYHDFPIVSRNIIESYFEINDYYTRFIDVPIPRSITDASAYYISDTNAIVFPISLHNPPFYYKNGPAYLNFGAIGAIIAHEMMHGFGKFDDISKNIYSDVFTNETNGLFINHTHCFEKQYDRFDASGLHKNNGTSTLRENVADSEGLRIAYQAYKKYNAHFGHKYQIQDFSTYTPDQLFFISYGTIWCYKGSPAFSNNIHSFPELRVNGAVSNSKLFASAFNCPKNSPMNPINKCTIW